VRKKLILAVLLGIGITHGVSQEMPLPPSLQMSLLLNVLSYERHLTAVDHGTVTIGILYQSTFRYSAWTRDEMLRLAENVVQPPGLSGRAHWVSFDLSQGEDLGVFLKRNEVEVLYLAPLRAVRVSAFADMCKDQGILTISGVPEYLTDGVVVATGQKGERPEILMNMNSARDEGADFDARLLKLARLIEAPSHEH
jgi:hypothetical protein